MEESKLDCTNSEISRQESVELELINQPISQPINQKMFDILKNNSDTILKDKNEDIKTIELIRSFMQSAYNIDCNDHIENVCCVCEKCATIKKKTLVHMNSLNEIMKYASESNKK